MLEGNAEEVKDTKRSYLVECLKHALQVGGFSSMGSSSGFQANEEYSRLTYLHVHVSKIENYHHHIDILYKLTIDYNI